MREEELPEDLYEKHERARKSVEAIKLTSSGKWALSANMKQAAQGIRMFELALQMIMSAMYDLSRNRDTKAKVTAIRDFVDLQVEGIRYSLTELISDIEDPTSEFHDPKRRTYIKVLSDYHRMSAEGVKDLEAYTAAIEDNVSDPEYKAMLLRQVEELTGTESDTLASIKNLLEKFKKQLDDKDDDEPKPV